MHKDCQDNTKQLAAHSTVRLDYWEKLELKRERKRLMAFKRALREQEVKLGLPPNSHSALGYDDAEDSEDKRRAAFERTINMGNASMLGDRAGEAAYIDGDGLALGGQTSRMLAKGVRQDIHMKMIKQHEAEKTRRRLGKKLRGLFRRHRLSQKWYGKIFNSIVSFLSVESEVYVNSSPIDDYIDEQFVYNFQGSDSVSLNSQKAY